MRRNDVAALMKGIAPVIAELVDRRVAERMALIEKRLNQAGVCVRTGTDADAQRAAEGDPDDLG